MAKIAADTKFEDWTPPWVEGEIDEAKVAKLLFNALQSETAAVETAKTLKTENAELKAANEVFKAASDEAAKEHDDATKKAVAAVTVKLETERDQEKERADAAERKNDLLQVRVQYPKIDEEDIDRLRGDDLDALLEDAKKFAEKHGLIDDGEEEEVDQSRHDESELRRQPRLRRTPGDPRPAGGSETNMDDYLEKRAQAGIW